MDGYQLLSVVILLASITTWLSLRNLLDNDRYHAGLTEYSFELIAMAVSWAAALLVAAYLLVI
jgi:hypothetical protein